MANFMSFDLDVDVLFDDALRELNTIRIVKSVNNSIKLNGIKHCCNKLINLSHANGDKHS